MVLEFGPRRNRRNEIALASLEHLLDSTQRLTGSLFILD
jgi:hypothetical protein